MNTQLSMQRALLAVGCVFVVLTAAAQTETVGTGGTFNISYGTASQSSGRIPFTDLGFQATASVTQGTVSGTLGGGTAFSLVGIGGNQTFTPGSSAVSLDYTPGWNGAINTAATGTLGVNFGYHLGPFSGSSNVFTDTITTGSAGADLTGALNSNTTASTSTTANGAGAAGSFGVKVTAGCPFCVTVASASLGFKVGSDVTQSVAWTPKAVYGDLVWYSKSTSLTASDVTTFVAGSGGVVSNTFAAPPSGLGLSSGQTFFMNVLPVVSLSMGIDNQATVAIPASVAASYNVLGSGGSYNASGNLYSLSTGDQLVTLDGTWYGGSAYSVELVEECTIPGVPCQYVTPASLPDPLSFGGGGLPAGQPISFLPPGSPTGTPGSDLPVLGPLIPGDTSDGGSACPPALGGQCLTGVTVTRDVPEPATFALLGLGLVGVISGRRRQQVGTRQA